MKTKQNPEKLKEEIAEIQKKISELKFMHPGSISMQYHTCRKVGCKCMHPTQPQPHGPYAKLAFTHSAKKACRFVRADCVEEINTRLSNYKTFRKLTDRWIELSILLAAAEFFSGSYRNKSPQK
jgi:hypothetical protein